MGRREGVVYSWFVCLWPQHKPALAGVWYVLLGHNKRRGNRSNSNRHSYPSQKKVNVFAGGMVIGKTHTACAQGFCLLRKYHNFLTFLGGGDDDSPIFMFSHDFLRSTIILGIVVGCCITDLMLPSEYPSC